MEPMDSKMVLALHPLCTLFPRMVGAEFDALKADILTNGQREPIVLHEGMVLDGGNRYLACVEAGVEPITTLFNGGDPISFVLSANFHRRHLSAGQQAAVVAAAQDWSSAHRHGGDHRSKVQPLHLDTAADRAKAANASLRTQRMADKVAKADPDLARRVAHGEISLPQAIEQLAPKANPAATSTPAAAPTSTPAPAPQPVAAAPAAPSSLVQQVLDQQPSAADDAPSAADVSAAEADAFEQLNLDYCTLLGQCAALQADKAELERRIATLTSGDDLAAQVDALALKCAQFDSLATARFNEIAGHQQVIAGQRSFIEGLRRAANLPKDGDLVAWIKNAARRAA